MEFSHMDFSLMKTEDLEILLKITEIDKACWVEEEAEESEPEEEEKDEWTMDQDYTANNWTEDIAI